MSRWSMKFCPSPLSLDDGGGDFEVHLARNYCLLLVLVISRGEGGGVLPSCTGPK